MYKEEKRCLLNNKIVTASMLTNRYKIVFLTLILDPVMYESSII